MIKPILQEVAVREIIIINKDGEENNSLVYYFSPNFSRDLYLPNLWFCEILYYYIIKIIIIQIIPQNMGISLFLKWVLINSVTKVINQSFENIRRALNLLYERFWKIFHLESLCFALLLLQSYGFFYYSTLTTLDHGYFFTMCSFICN